MRLEAIFLFASLLPIAGAQPGLSRPALGHAYDPDLRAIRPILGIPGAALLGDPLPVGFPIATAAIAQEYALAVSADDGGVRLLRWSNGELSAVALSGALVRPDRLVFSPDGKAALLYDSSSRRAQVLTGFSTDTSIREIPTTSTVAAIAIADDSTVALATDAEARIVRPDQNTFPMPLPAGIVALAFDTSGHALLAATLAGDLYLAAEIDANLAVSLIRPADPQTADPVAVQFSSIQSTALLATRNGVISRIDLKTADSAAASCGCVPTNLLPFGRPGLFRLTEISAAPLSLFDGAPASPRLWFVPADAKRSAQ